MDNKTHIAESRSAAMENYVDFSGEKKSWLGYEQVQKLPDSDKNKYIALAVGSTVLQIGAGIYGVYLIRNKYGKSGFWWGALGFFALSIPTGILLNGIQKVTIQKKLEDKLSGNTLSGAERAIAMAKENNARMMASDSYGEFSDYDKDGDGQYDFLKPDFLK
jgi:hypothetical protein